MKKLLILFISALALSTFATAQYVTVDPYISNVKADTENAGLGRGNYFWVHVSENNTRLYILDKISTAYSSDGNTEVLSKVMSAYGYVDKATGALSTALGGSAVFKYNDRGVYQYGYLLGTFNAGSDIGIWIADKNGLVSTSTDTASYVRAVYPQGVDAFDTILGELDYTSGKSIFFGIGTDAGTSPNGQPLPGFLATLLLGGGSLFGFRMLGRRSRKA